jgi:hypothetical protein
MKVLVKPEAQRDTRKNSEANAIAIKGENEGECDCTV